MSHNTNIPTDKPSDNLFRLLSAYIIFIGAAMALTLGVSALGVRIPQMLSIAVLVVAAIAGYIQWRHCAKYPVPVQSTGKTSNRIATALISMAFATYVLMWIFAYIAPDISCDGNIYHIPPINEWARIGCVHWVNPNLQHSQFMNGYPKAVEVIAFLLVKVFSANDLLNTANLVFIPLGVLGIASIALSLGAPTRIAVAAGSAFILIPVNIAQSSTLYVDSGYACCVVAFIAMLARVASGIEKPSSLPWHLVPSLGCAAGLTIGAKGTGFIAVSVGFLVVMSGLAARLLTSDTRQRMSVIRKWVALSALTFAIMMCVGGYFYIRNYVITGSPIYPVGLSIGHLQVFPGASCESAIAEDFNTPPELKSMSRGHQILYTWMQGFRKWPKSILPIGAHLGGLGFLWVMGCLPAILYLAIQYRHQAIPTRVKWIFYCLATAIALTFVFTPANWWARYTAWLYALGLPAFAVVVSKQSAEPVKRKVFSLWVLVCISLCMIEGTLSLLMKVPNPELRSLRNSPSQFVHAAFRVQDWKWPVCYQFPQMAGTVFEDIIRYDKVVALGPMNGWDPADDADPVGRMKATIMGQLSEPIGTREIIPVQPGILSEECHQIISRGVRHLIWDDAMPLPEYIKQIAVAKCHVPGFWAITLPLESGAPRGNGEHP